MTRNRVGLGYDLHRMEAGHELILGGVRIPHDKGLVGHSDADALLHAICDALLGAVGAGDIGTFFPPGDESLRGISSLEMLRRVKNEILGSQWGVVNVDTVIVTDEPAVGPYRAAICDSIGKALGISPDRVGVKAKTTEGLGPLAGGKALEAHAMVYLESAQ
jgi:2-C-methyl-D-erythritol 2,4-cyclodiphosphate synthase